MHAICNVLRVISYVRPSDGVAERSDQAIKQTSISIPSYQSIRIIYTSALYAPPTLSYLPYPILLDSTLSFPLSPRPLLLSEIILCSEHAFWGGCFQVSLFCFLSIDFLFLRLSSLAFPFPFPFVVGGRCLVCCPFGSSVGVS